MPGRHTTAVDAHAIDLNGDAFEFRTRLEYEDDLAAKGVTQHFWKLQTLLDRGNFSLIPSRANSVADRLADQCARQWGHVRD